MNHGEFNRLMATRYHAMQTRFQTRYSARGRVTQVGREIPFTQQEYAQWILELLGGIPSGRVECTYCRHAVTVADLEIDHRLSPQQGGELGFDNLEPCCSPCNKQKGAMSGTGFRQLLELLNSGHFSRVDRDNILGRLQRETRFVFGSRKRRDQSNTVRLNPMGRIRQPMTE
jgi:5-methylcytosine-specific restriction endonuclease McrA